MAPWCCVRVQRHDKHLFRRGARSHASRLGGASHCHRPTLLRRPPQSHHTVHRPAAFDKPGSYPAPIVSAFLIGYSAKSMGIVYACCVYYWDIWLTEFVWFLKAHLFTFTETAAHDCFKSVCIFSYLAAYRKGIRPVKNWVGRCWRGYLSEVRCRLAYGPADATATHCVLLQ